MIEQTRQVGDRTLVVRCEDHLAAQATWLLDTLLGFQNQGKGLADGVTIGVGGSRLTLREHGTRLVVCEPDFADDPFHEVVEDVTRSLLVLGQQRDLSVRLHVDPVWATFDEKIVLARDALSVSHIYMERKAATPGDSGWYIGPIEGDTDKQDYEALYVYQLLGRRPALMQVLALPPGYLVVFDGDRIEAILNGEGDKVLALGT